MLLFLSADSPEPKGRKAVVMLTLRKLKEMVESPKKGEKKPSCKSLRKENARLLLRRLFRTRWEWSRSLFTRTDMWSIRHRTG